MGMTIKIEGQDRLKEILDNIKTKTMQEVNVALAESAIILQEEAKASVEGFRAETRSVDTGAFLNSIQNFANGNEAGILSDVGHAIFLEFGTSKMEARSHFRNSLERIIPIVMQKVSDAVARTI